MEKTIATNLKRYRRLNHVTQEQLSKMSCVPRVSIARYETGVHIPDLPAAVKLAKAIGITVDELIQDEVKSDGRR